METGVGVSLRTGSLGRRGRDGVSGYRLLLSRRQDTVRAPRRPVQTLLSQRDGRRRPTSEGGRNRGGRLGPASARGPGGGGLRRRSPSRPGPPSSRLAAGVHPTVTVAGEPARRGTARPLRVHLTRPTVQMNLQSSVWSWLLNQGLHRRGEVPGTGRGGGDRVCSGPSPCGTPSSSSVWRQARTTNSARATLRRPPRGLGPVRRVSGPTADSTAAASADGPLAWARLRRRREAARLLLVLRFGSWKPEL